MALVATLVVLAAISLPVAAATSPAQLAAEARAAQARGDFAAAVKDYAELARLNPGVAEIYSNLGIAYYFDGRRAEAIHAFDQALKLKPNLTAALVFSGIAHYDLSNIPEARLMLRRAVGLNPADPLAQTWLGYCDLAQSHPASAVKRFETAAKLDPKSADVWYGLGKTYLALGQRAIRQLAASAPDGARMWELAGDQWALRSNRDQAIFAYREALRRRPGLEGIRKSLDALHPAQDSSDVSATVSKRPTYAEKAADAIYFEARANEQRARAAFEQVGTVAPGSYRAHQVLAESLTAEGRFDRALAQYREMLRLRPDLAGTRLAMGNTLMRMGKAGEAVKQYQAELALRPGNADCLFRLGEAWIVLGNGAAAKAALEHALASGSTVPQIQRDLGRIYLHEHDYPQAAKALSVYLKLQPEDASGHYALMQAYQALGERAAAGRERTLFERASADRKRRAAARQALSAFEQNP